VYHRLRIKGGTAGKLDPGILPPLHLVLQLHNISLSSNLGQSVSCEVGTETFKYKLRSLDKARPHTENIRGLNLAAVMCTTVQVSKLLY
jgi:hypothetical protein